MKFSREWAMPNKDTFSIPVIGEFVYKYTGSATVSVDPFARNCRWAHHTNDLDPSTLAESHMDAREFLIGLAAKGIRCDLAFFDPPYSPRQISECYKSIGQSATTEETQNSALYSKARDALVGVLTDDAVVLSFGWNSVGMGKKHGFEIVEILLVCHGGAHNDTICLAERRTQSLLL